ncbi:hypothetical protein HPP92_008460 [Vanilla planifolia]|uniref:Uncharacterized protein n=1 Tax=Vanilla planifolia TaxID=51239 RepID=A0A835R833_VANPL|nr:hypothetical protein HPP92_008460 [Vanilla planifolia]
MEGISEEIEIHFGKLRAEQSKTEQEKRKTGHAAGKIGPLRCCGSVPRASSSLVKPMDKRKNLKEKLLWKQGTEALKAKPNAKEVWLECALEAGFIVGGSCKDSWHYEILKTMLACTM